ncbi:LAQU0S03e01178g1_1 [Lachancea quebecensis]|uniref:LAQU0S03e01178g1_1 n=1 Tax=Lachancea quebecensis TaxID=1654605 RepID=A0A0P1KMX2_9SACH|nr:LAQU0S03e01178g1_1 [Lachancea quebecensis]
MQHRSDGPQQPTRKRLKASADGFPGRAAPADNTREAPPLIDDAMCAISMSARQNSSDSTTSSPYVEIEDYILEGYGSALINGSYHSRLSLDNITPVNYCLYDKDLEEFDDSDNGTSDGKTLVETPESQDVDMDMDMDIDRE